MCVSVLLVLGDKIKSEIDEKKQEQWLLSYVGKVSFNKIKTTPLKLQLIPVGDHFSKNITEKVVLTKCNRIVLF